MLFLSVQIKGLSNENFKMIDNVIKVWIGEEEKSLMRTPDIKTTTAALYAMHSRDIWPIPSTGTLQTLIKTLMIFFMRMKEVPNTFFSPQQITFLIFLVSEL